MAAVPTTPQEMAAAIGLEPTTYNQIISSIPGFNILSPEAQAQAVYKAAGGTVEGGSTLGAQTTGGTTPTYDPAVAAAQARVSQLRGDIRGYQPQIEEIYNSLFADLDTLVKDRAANIEKETGNTLEKLTSTYTNAIPGIQSSYSALGAGDSTDTTYAKVNAKEGFEDSTEEVGKQKQKDLTTLGQFDATTRAGWGADKEALDRIFSRLDETDNEQDLATARGDVETKLGTAKANKASLMTDEGLKGSISKNTDGSSRLSSIQSSLDTILKSSLSGGVKEAAIEAVSQSAGLTDEEKNQIKANSAYQQ